jgi:D-sedoheptulose 7-phosphate isomerase
MTPDQRIMVPRSGTMIGGHLAGVLDLIEATDQASVEAVLHAVIAASLEGRAVFVFGNGGSAATAEHFAADLLAVSGAKPMCLASNTAQLTAAANDHGYHSVFVRQLQTWMHPDDLVIGFSVSGTSPNAVAALEYAKQHGAETIAFVGSGPSNSMVAFADHAVVVPSADHRSVESVHLVMAHAIAAGLAEIGHPAGGYGR